MTCLDKRNYSHLHFFYHTSINGNLTNVHI